MRFAILLFLHVGLPACTGLEATLYLERIGNYTKDYADIFVMPILIGTPERHFNLTLDFSQTQATIIGAGSTTPRCTANHRGFDVSRSTTFRRTSTDTTDLEVYMVGNKCRVALSADAIVGHDDVLQKPQIPFEVISHFTGAYNELWPSDGVFGLLGPSAQSSPSAAKALAQTSGGSAIVAFYADDERVPHAEVGKIAFGEVPKRCEPVQYAGQYYDATRNGWNFRVNGASLGMESRNLGGKGFITLSQSMLARFDAELLGSFMDQIEARKNNATGNYVVECGRVASLPDFHVTLDGVKLAFTADDYVDMNSQTADGHCEILFREEPAGSLFWTFGNLLLKSHCVALDFDRGNVGFATIRPITPVPQ
ncbi:cathepsin D [Aphelenchoides avenae]|nr:cathepsin D [Aphelenchus avenae]